MMLDQWSSYSLRDFIPLEMEVYVNLFSRVNQHVWPWTILLTVVSFLIVVLLIARYYRQAYMILGVAWCLCAYFFYYEMLSELHWVGYVFASMFVIQGCFLFVWGIIVKLDVQSKKIKRTAGVLIMMLSIAVGLVIPLFDNRPWQSIEVFGIAPNPTSWLTVGALMMQKMRGYIYVMIIPVLWVLISLAVVYATY